MIVATRPLRSLFLTLLALLALFGAAARAFEARDLGTEDFEISDVYQHGDMDKPEEFGHLDIRRVLKRVAQLRAAGQHVPRGDAEIADRMDEFRYSGLRKVSHPTATEEFPEYYVDTILDIEPEEANTMSLPNVKDKATVLELAKMTSNAYYSSSESKEWYTLPTYGKPAMSFGWSGNALRGYVYTNASKSVAVIDFKGTSLSFLGIGGPTSANDKIIDNRMFSCCCARVSSGWKTVCDCYRGNGSDNKCSNSCLRSAMQNDSLSYYKAALNIYNQVRSKYPKATVWFTGHSLGGSLASLLSVKTGYPAVPYHAPGELLYGQRLGLPINTGNMGAYSASPRCVFLVLLAPLSLSFLV